MKNLILLAGVISKNEVRYNKIVIVNKKATITLLFEASEDIYKDFKRELVSSGFGISYEQNSSILEITEK